MELLLVRHAIAVERNSKGYIDDRARPLTPEGRKRMAESAAGIAKLFTPAEILTSPVLRAPDRRNPGKGVALSGSRTREPRQR